MKTIIGLTGVKESGKTTTFNFIRGVVAADERRVAEAAAIATADAGLTDLGSAT